MTQAAGPRGTCAGAEARPSIKRLSARLKPCPVTKLRKFQRRVGKPAPSRAGESRKDGGKGAGMGPSLGSLQPCHFWADRRYHRPYGAGARIRWLSQDRGPGLTTLLPDGSGRWCPILYALFAERVGKMDGGLAPRRNSRFPAGMTARKARAKAPGDPGSIKGPRSARRLTQAAGPRGTCAGADESA